MKTKLCLIILLLLVIIPLVYSVNEEKSVNFILFGHTYVDYFALNKSIDKINSIKPDFVIFLGDSVVSGEDPKKTWELFLNIKNKIKSKVYFAAGNHDVEDENALKYYEENISKFTYDFSYGENQFIVLNSVNFKETQFDISPEQIDLLKSYLNKDYKNRFILMHHCLWYNEGSMICNYNADDKNKIWNSEIIPLLKNKVNKIFVGDAGNIVPFFSYKNEGLNYIGIGFSESLPREPQFFLHVTLDNGNVSIKPILITEDIYAYDGFYKEKFSIYLFIIQHLKIILIFIIIISGIIGGLLYTSFRKLIKKRRF